MKELTPEDLDRARKAMKALELAEEKLSEGSEFAKAKDSEFFTNQRDRFRLYGAKTLISQTALEWLQDIAEQHLKRYRERYRERKS